MKNYFTQFMGGYFIVGFSSLAYVEYLYFIVQQCRNISCMVSLDETMLNMQLYRKYFNFMMVYRSLSFLNI